MSADKQHMDQDRMLRYLKGELSRDEHYEVERYLEKDPFAREALEGLQKSDPRELRGDLLDLQASLGRRLRRRRRVALYSVAATVASLLIVGTLFLRLYDFTPANNEKQAPLEMPVPMDKSAQGDPVEEAKAESRAEPPAAVAEAPVMVSPEKIAVTPAVEPTATVAEAPAEESPATKADLPSEPPAKASRAQAPMQAAAETPPKAADEIVHQEYAAGETFEMEVEEQPVNRSSRKSGKRVAPAAAEQTEIAHLAVQGSEMQGKVSGIVISAEDLDPIPGASIMLQGRTDGILSDREGRFVVDLDEEEDATIVASFIGMEQQELKVSQGEQVELLMQPSPSTLDEVVVVAYGTPEKEIYPQEFSPARPTEGYRSFKRYIEENMQNPPSLQEKKHVVVLRFMVGSDGEISDIEVVRSPGEAFHREAIRLLSEGPAWDAAIGEDGPTAMPVRMRIVFKYGN